MYYMQSYSIFFKGYAKTAFAQVLYTHHKLCIQKSHICGMCIDLNQGVPTIYYMWHCIGDIRSQFKLWQVLSRAVS